MKASDLFVKCLEAEGVEYIFGIPGEENLDLLESLRNSPIQLILTRHEQGAGFMAATYGRLTGKTGVCLSTLGPGATNLVTPAAYAQLGGMPMLMITGQKPVKHSKQGQFQIVNIVDMMRPITKYTRQIISGDTIPSRIREAFRLAEEERPGAVHLELPENIAAEQTCQRPFVPGNARRPVAEDKSITRAVTLLKESHRPLILIGAGANRKLTATMLRALIDKQKIPFISTQMGKGVVDENHDLCIGNAALSSGDFLHRAIDAADLILNVGHDVVEKPPFFMEEGTRQVIHINFNSAAVDPVYFPQTEVIGDIANSIWQINENLEPQPQWDFCGFYTARNAMQCHTSEMSNAGGFPLYPERVVSDVRKVMGEGDIIALDNGIYKIWFARNYKASCPNTVLLDNALATMGAGLPSAMAAKLVDPGKRVMAICGDGGFMMNSQEMETAVRLGLDLVVLILNDSAYGMIQWKQSNMRFENWGLEFNNPCFVTYAESYGASGHRVEKTEDLVPVLERCFTTGGVHLVDCPVNYSKNHWSLNIDIKNRSAAISS